VCENWLFSNMIRILIWQNNMYSSWLYYNVFTVLCAYMVHIVHYRFNEDGSNNNPIRCVYIICDQSNACIFKSTVTHNELPIATTSNPLPTTSICYVNYVEIIHDCVPRRIQMILNFTSHDNSVYLQVWNAS